MKMKRIFTPLILLLCLFYWRGSSPASAAVGLFNFQANSETDGIELTWQTGFEDNNIGFNLFRATVNDRNAATQVNSSLIPTQSQGGGGASYDYLDDTVSLNILYYYWVETVGDVLAEPVPPASAIWTTGSGLVTNTPGPTSTPLPHRWTCSRKAHSYRSRTPTPSRRAPSPSSSTRTESTPI